MMKKAMIALLLAALALNAVVGSALAMTEEELLETVKANEGNYVPGSPLTRNDFIRWESGSYSGPYREVFTDDSYMEKYEYDEILYQFAGDYRWTHTVATRKDDLEHDSFAVSYTYRGVNTDFDTKENVLEKYGIGVSGEFDPNNDDVYKWYKSKGYDTESEMLENCKTYLLYNFKDFAQIKFYFNSDDEICFIVYFNGVQATADKETTRKIQEYLNENGYDCGSPDGIAGNKTKEALKKYQEDHELYPSGYIDDVLMKHLDGKL